MDYCKPVVFNPAGDWLLQSFFFSCFLPETDLPELEPDNRVANEHFPADPFRRYAVQPAAGTKATVA